MQDHGVIVRRLDAVHQFLPGRAIGAGEAGVELAHLPIEGILNIGRGQRLAVMEGDTLADIEFPGGRTEHGPGGGQIGHVTIIVEVGLDQRGVGYHQLGARIGLARIDAGKVIVLADNKRAARQWRGCLDPSRVQNSNKTQSQPDGYGSERKKGKESCHFHRSCSFTGKTYVLAQNRGRPPAHII